MKKGVSVWVTSLLVASIFMTGCSCGPSVGSIAGSYVSQSDPSCYIELEKDGTFYCHEFGMGFEGEWILDDDRIILISSAGDAVTGTIENKDTIITNEGIIYRRGEPQEDIVSPPEGKTVPTEEQEQTPSMEYENDPRTPEEIVKAYFHFLNEGSYWEAARLFIGFEEYIASGKASESQLAQFSREGADFEGQLLEVEIVQVSFTEGGELIAEIYEYFREMGIPRTFDEGAEVSFVLHLRDEQEVNDKITLVKYKGKWRLAPIE